MLRNRFIVLILFLLTIPVLSVRAHANLIRSAPPAGTQVPETPEEIRLFFTEPLESQFSRIELRNALGKIVDLPSAQLDPDDDKQLVLIPGDLADGLYTVAWRVVSQMDGHLTQGSFPIIVGAVAGLTETQSSIADETVPIDSALIRWLNLLSLALLVGSVAFWLFVWHPSAPESNPQVERRMQRVVWAGWLAVGFSSALVALLQAQIVSGGDWTAALGAVAQVLGGTRFGQLWWPRIGLWFLFGAILWRGKLQAQRIPALLLVLGAALLFTQSLFSHASGAADTMPAVFADWMHLLAMSIWIGGLIQFVVVIGPIRQLPGHLFAMVARFSNMARFSVAILIITGTFAGWLQVGSLDALFTTQYGQTLTVKLLLFLPLLAIGAINLFFTYQGLRAGNAVWSKRLRYLVSLEITLAAAILLAVGIMTAIVPARITAAVRAIPASSDDTFFKTAFENDLTIQLTIDPGTVGENTFFINLRDKQTGDAIDDASLIRLRFEQEAQNIGESELRPEFQGDGRYTITGSNLSAPGNWRIRMTIQRPDQFDTVVDFEPSITLPNARATTFDPSPGIEARGLALLLTGLAGAIVCSVFLLTMRQRVLHPQTVLTAIFLAGSLVLTQRGLQLLSNQGLTNPITPDANSMLIGEILYAEHCVMCHGATGRGDGVLAVTLNPRPADLAIHTVPGAHTDGELFSWISDGFSSTAAMPAFRTVLSDEERWHLVNYIRTFGQQDEPDK